MKPISRDQSNTSSDFSGGSSEQSLASSSSSESDDASTPSNLNEFCKNLCQNSDVFAEFFSPATWNDLPEPVRSSLGSLVPGAGMDGTIEALFSGKLARFGENPLQKVRKKLAEEHFRPAIATLQRSKAKAERREQRYQERERLSSTARNLLESRELLLQSASYSIPVQNSIGRKTTANIAMYTSANISRAKKRYLQEINATFEQLGQLDSDDESYGEGIVNYLPRKQRRYFGSVQGTTSNSGVDMRIVDTHSHKDKNSTSADYPLGPNGKIFISEEHYRDLLSRYKYTKYNEANHPEIDCSSLKLEDVVFRTQTSSGYRRIMPFPKVVETLAPQTSSEQLSQNSKVNIPQASSPAEVGKSSDNSPIAARESEVMVKRYRLSDSFDASEPRIELEQKHVQIGSQVAEEETSSRADVDQLLNARLVHNKPAVSSAKSTFKMEYDTSKALSDRPHAVRSVIAQELKPKQQLIPTIDSKSNLARTNTDEASEKRLTVLMQEIHSSFLALIRDMFCSTPDHRLTLNELKMMMKLWLNKPTARHNNWFHQANDNWDDMLQSAILFLSGEFVNQPDDFVPYLEFKSQLNIYQWIGASRDSDVRLLNLCQYWLGRKNDMGAKSQLMSSSPPEKAISKPKYNLPSVNHPVEDNNATFKRESSPPLPKNPTDWLVKKATQDEIALFRSQEKIRYENPHMAFTFKHPAYTSVVGPVKGIYTQVPGITKARGHNMLVADRPNFVTILALVRDATARLPNGEGTRADICELLKSSQYISQSAIENPQVLQTIVSGALDRMHTELDPCVKYDTKRKIWIYLHRNRTEQEFEMLHHQYQGIAKHKKTICRKSKSKDFDVTTPEKESPPSTSTAISVPLERDLSDTSLSSENSSQPKPPLSTSSSSSSSMVIQMTNSASMRPSFQIKPLPLQPETPQKHIVGRSVVQMAMKSAIFNELDRQVVKE
uniref:Nuclear factor related to kappa-B-binding protein n=1 Tax=Culex pipiens TaxID=7175 RepID=A0A8D8CHI5_CULPI